MLQTDRIALRQWRQSDREALAALNADPRVMEYFPSVLSRSESTAIADYCQAQIAERGWGVWVAEEKATHQFLGIVGLNVPSHALPFSPCVEVLWRLAREHWGKGYATEAAREVLRFGFEDLALYEIVSFTVTGNERSRAVMRRLGMEWVESFEHPEVPFDSGLRQHELYRLSRERYRTLQTRDRHPR